MKIRVIKRLILDDAMYTVLSLTEENISVGSLGREKDSLTRLKQTYWLNCLASG